MVVLMTGPPAYADTPPDPVHVISPVNGTHVPYGTSTLHFIGEDKRPGDNVSIGGNSGCLNSSYAVDFPNDWNCDQELLPMFEPTQHIPVIPVSPTFNSGPTVFVDLVVDPSQFSAGTPTIVGQTVTITGVRDATSTTVSAELNPGAIAADGSDCALDSPTTYTCTFSNVPDAKGYSVTVAQHLQDAHEDDLSTGPFDIGTVSPPNTPGKPKPPSTPNTPANPTIAPLLPIIDAPLVPGSTPTPAPTSSTTPAPPDTTPSGPAAPDSKRSPGSDKTSKATKHLLQFGIAGVVLMGIGGGRGLARSALRVDPEGKVVFAWRDDGEVERKVDLAEKIGIGDRSPTWRFPWHAPIDALSLILPSKLAPRSPFLGRLAADGAEIRAAFGTLWLLFPAAGAVLGALALTDTSGHPVPPAYWLVLSITALAIFDALAGAIATLVFFGGILLSGGFWNEAEPDFAHSVLVFLILSVLWTSLPLIGTATRPFRRLGKPSARYAWDRIADLIIASLLCAWIAQKSLEVMDLFSGTETGLEHHADQIAIVVIVMTVLRIVIEHMASIWYPRRLAEVEIDGELPPPTRAANLVGVVIRTAAYSFIGHVFIGTCWQWWLGTALFFLPQVGALVQHRFAGVELLKRLMPKGIVEIFVLIVACTLAVRYAEHHNESEREAIRYAFLALALPPALIGMVALFGGEGERGKRTWAREILGLVILIATVALALAGWEY